MSTTFHLLAQFVYLLLLINGYVEMLVKLTHFVAGGFFGLFLSGWIFFIDVITEHPNSYLPFIIAGSVGVVFGLLASIFEERFWDKIYFLKYLY